MRKQVTQWKIKGEQVYRDPNLTDQDMQSKIAEFYLCAWNLLKWKHQVINTGEDGRKQTLTSIPCIAITEASMYSVYLTEESMWCLASPHSRAKCHRNAEDRWRGEGVGMG